MFYSKKFIKFKNINHCFFSKNGGVSEGIYDSLNCGINSGDKKENVYKNLNIVSKKIGLNIENLPKYKGDIYVSKVPISFHFNNFFLIK